MNLRRHASRLAMRILECKLVARPLVKALLRLNHWSAAQAGSLSCLLEPDGLHPKHRITRYHDWFMERLRPEWRVLDIGCGNGAMARDLRQVCAEVVGVDLNPRNIEIARARYAAPGIDYLCADALKYPFEAGFAAATLSNVLEHIEDRAGFLIDLRRRLGPNCLLLVRVPLLTRDWLTPYKRELGLEWRLDSTHWTEYEPQQLRQELALAGYGIESLETRFGELFALARPLSGDA